MVIISFVAEKDFYFPGISLDERRRDLRVMLSGRRYVQIKNRIALVSTRSVTFSCWIVNFVRFV